MRCPRYSILAATLLAVATSARANENLVRNGNFRAVRSGMLPAEWAAWTPLEDSATCTLRAESDGLRIAAGKDPFSVGGVSQDVQGIAAAKAYAIDAECVATEIASPLRTLMVRLLWTRGGKPVHPAGMLVRGPKLADGSLCFHDVLVAPADADGARLTLEVKWPEGGSVLWRRVSMSPSAPPPARKVKIGTVYFRPSHGTPERNLQQFGEQIDAGGRLGLDIVCLPEAITAVGTGRSVAQVAEPIPGPAVEQLAAAAKRNHLWVVGCLNERDGERIYNTAVLLDRQGSLVGKYRKVHLPREEWTKGIVPGGEYPVFQTELGTIAIQICYDWFFPEVATIWALKGAEIVFAPTWGTTFPDRDGRVEGETVFRVRARDNGFFLVPSVYDGDSMIIDPLGRILASSQGRPGLVWCEVDLARREPLEWVGHWRSIAPRDRMPETYAPLTARP